MSDLTKIVLTEHDMPTHWYNINADLPAAGVELPPPLHPGTKQPVGHRRPGPALSHGLDRTGSHY